MDLYLKHRIENITDRDFWSAIRPSGDLKTAVAAGLAGRRERAYTLLGTAHARTLATEAEVLRASVQPCAHDRSAAANLRRRADRVVRHEIQGWHSKTIAFGRRIDFNADFGRSGQYGFHYLGWLRPVLEAYALTGVARYRDAFLDIISQYYEQRCRIRRRIASLHPVYYELGAHAKIDLILPAYALLTGESAVHPAQREAMLKLLLGMARSLYRIEEKGYRRGNWQIVGAQSLFHLACAFPEFRESAAWRARSRRLILQHAQAGFLADGGHIERCWGYGWMSLRGMLGVYETGCRYGRLGPVKAPLSRLLRKAFRWFAATVSPTLEHLNYGDGSIAPARGVFETARRVFPDMARRPGLLGVDRSRSRILRPSGYAFMTADNRPDAPFLSINFGKWGGGHTHQDLLDFSLWRYGEPLIEEVGRFGSYDNPMDPWFRSPQAHNQVVIDYARMDRPAHAGRAVVWHSTPAADFFSAEHEAYRQACGAVVRRQIVFVKPDYWVIHDRVDAPDKIFQVSDYLHSPRPFIIAGAGRAFLKGPRSCLVAFAEPSELRRFCTDLDYGPADGPPDDRHTRERHRLMASAWRDIGDPRPITFTFLLLPFRGLRPPKAVIRPAGPAGAYEVIHAGRRDLVRFDGDAAPGTMAVRIANRWIRCPARGHAVTSTCRSRP